MYDESLLGLIVILAFNQSQGEVPSSDHVFAIPEAIDGKKKFFRRFRFTFYGVCLYGKWFVLTEVSVWIRWAGTVTTGCRPIILLYYLCVVDVHHLMSESEASDFLLTRVIVAGCMVNGTRNKWTVFLIFK